MAKLQPVEYRISFMTPEGGGKDCVDYDAATPFQAVHVGDQIVGMTWRGFTHHPYGDTLGPVARVTRVDRLVQIVAEQIFDITIVHTEFLPGHGV